MSAVLHADLPRVVCFGEALTELARTGADTWRSSSGGSPWRVAVALSALGQLGAFAGAIGRDPFGEEIWRASREAHLDLRFIQQLPRPSLLALAAEPGGAHSLLIGQDSADLHFRPEGLPAGWTRALRWAHFGGLGLVREPLAGRLQALAQALKAEGRLISYAPRFCAPWMDLRYDDTLALMCGLADVIQVSEQDLRGLFRVPDARSGLAQIAAWNPRAWLLLTRGAADATLYHGEAECSARPPQGAVVDSAGADDAALAGLLDSLMREPGAAPGQHLRWALAAGAAACTDHGFAPPPDTLVAALAAGVNVAERAA